MVAKRVPVDTLLLSEKAGFTRSMGSSAARQLLHLITTCIILICFTDPEDQYFPGGKKYNKNNNKPTLEKTLFPSALAASYYPLCFGLHPTTA